MEQKTIQSGGGAGGPRRIAHFEILGRLGAGGMGVVYRGRDEVLEREVALKLIRPDAAGDDEARRRFLREARLAASISHQSVATLFEAGESVPDGEDEPQLFFASELVDGRSLDVLLGDGVISPDRAVDLGIQLAEALAAAHSLGIVHRDIKPSNLMVGEDDRLKVLDFGVAKRIGWSGEAGDDEKTLTCTERGAVVGTPAYMAPEQVAGEAADSRTDIHGAGCVLYQMLVGRPPFGSGSPSEVMRRVIVTPPEPLQTLRAEIPGALAAVVEKALAKRADDRYQSADDLAQALRSAADTTGAVQAKGTRGGSAGRWIALAAILMVIFGAAVLVGKKHLGSALPFEERDWLLVADVVNQTGDDGFTLALKSALETDLRQSSHVNVFDSGQVRNTLRFMRRDGMTGIDLETGLEVCRFAGVRALLVPQIDVVDDVYILQASLVDPATGHIADRIRITAKGRDQVLLESIDELTRAVRRRLGESLESISDSDPALIQYTTSSWEALRLVALGSNQWAANLWAEAAESFEFALEEDPDFSIARASLGLLKIQFLESPEEGREMLVQALADASRVSRREYLMLRAVNRQFVDRDFEAALADYRLVSELYPDLVQPYNNSGIIYRDLGRYEEAVRMFARAREVDPRSILPVRNMWWVLNQYLKRPVEAEEPARALVELQPDSAWAHHSLGWTLVSLRRFEEAEEHTRKVLEIDPHHPYAVSNLAHLLYRRGSFEEAIEMYRQNYREMLAGDHPHGDFFSGLCFGLALERAGRTEEAVDVYESELARIRLARDEGEQPVREICLLAASGREAESRAMIEKIEASKPTSPYVLLMVAEAYALLEDLDAATRTLERAFEAGYDDPYNIVIDPLLSNLQNKPVIDRLAPVR